ncbi:MAG: 50S ribosomal protein L35 [Saprospiraceae bacterium]|jgi:large subunit ribosomal protein L35|nr:50S ribosomal protein L35 [Saprospiraceae bacterium]
MPKMKTHTGAKKRFFVTGSGRVKRFHAFHSHLMRKKTNVQKLGLRQVAFVDVADEKRILRLLCK